MLGLVFKDNRVQMDDNLPEIAPSKGEVIVDVIYAGICSTDLEIARGYMGFEGVMGHEFVGRVHGSQVSPLLNKRVVGKINCNCGTCDFCEKGLERHCPNRTVLGILGRDGAFAQSLVLPEKNLVEVPESVSSEDAVYGEPLAAALRIHEQVKIRPHEKVVVLGDGRLGLLVCGVGLALGWNLHLVGLSESKMQIISGLSHWYKPGEAQKTAYDVAIDCTGSPDGVQEAMRLLKPLGKLVMKTTTFANKPFDFSEIVINEINLIGSRCGSMKQAMDFLKKGEFKPSVLTSAIFPLSQGEKAFKAAGNPSSIKVLLDISDHMGAQDDNG